MVLDEGLSEANELAGTTGAVAWKLHPPALRALGIDRKISIGTVSYTHLTLPTIYSV